MTSIDRRRLLALGAASLTLPPAIQRAWAIDARSPTGTIEDVKHVVILMQENRGFDHYFGAMPGVRGFGDRFPIPLPGGRTVWSQASTKGGPPIVAPFPLDTAKTAAHMRVEGTPHSWADAQYAWDNGRMGAWPDQKHAHAMAYYEEKDIPFQWALANAFTICDAYHCSFIGGTNTNRLFLWSGSNDGAGKFGGPSISNSHDTLPDKGGAKEPYLWKTYCERLEEAGVSWKIYEDMADNFGDNPLVGFKAFRDSLAGAPGSNSALAAKGLSTQHLDVLRADVMSGGLPSVSWVISPAADSEHPGPSSPAQGADYIARVLDCLTANPDVWASTVLLVNFDENDGFFDHVPPPAPPSRDASGKLLGASSVDTAGEYHLVRGQSEKAAERDDLIGRPYGLGPRVPMYVVSPFARGGWVNSEVFDHTSCIRFLEKRFGVMEPNISPWRRAVCGDLTSCFDFEAPNDEMAALPATKGLAEHAATFTKRTTPTTPIEPVAPVQAKGVRRSRALPYHPRVADLHTSGPLRLAFMSIPTFGKTTEVRAIVFHAYDLLRLDLPPRRYTVGMDRLEDEWPEGRYDVCVFGPNGAYWRFKGSGGPRPEVAVGMTESGPKEIGVFVKSDTLDDKVRIEPVAYQATLKPWTGAIRKPSRNAGPVLWKLASTQGWFDFVVTREGDSEWSMRFAGRHETGVHGFSDPAMGGAAAMTWT